MISEADTNNIGSEKTDVILGCGHPCLMCMQQQNSPVTAFSKDHTYFKTAPVKDCETSKEKTVSEQLMERPEEVFVSDYLNMRSTSMKTLEAVQQETDMDTCILDDNLLDLSELSSFRDDPSDKTFMASDRDTDSDRDLDLTGPSEVDLISDNILYSILVPKIC